MNLKFEDSAAKANKNKNNIAEIKTMPAVEPSEVSSSGIS
jgi:hypothetical protein